MGLISRVSSRTYRFLKMADEWFWFIRYDGGLLPLYPNRSVTIGKNSSNVIRLGKRPTATSKNFISLKLENNLKSLNVSFQKGCTLKVYANKSNKVTSARPQTITNNQEIYIEKEEWEATFWHRSNIKIVTLNANV